MSKLLNPLTGVFVFLSLSFTTVAANLPTEVLIELRQPVTLQQDASGTRTTLPDLDELIKLFPGISVSHALANVERHSDLKRFLLIRFSSNLPDRSATFISKALKLYSVHWSGINRAMHCTNNPNDPYYPQQWGLQRIVGAQAWDYTTGSASIPIAIIDTGCEMDHPDLINSIWTNEYEIPTNGIDDDLNGFIDDVKGWDFVDAPSFPTSGDYLVRDNDPSDEMGHGTAVAGICGAQINNSIGIAGTSPDCPLMILRAGNANGYLEEDDVASAILYAVDNGARIINMSFGDAQASPMLEEVVNYASGQGVLLIAAAGNSGTEDPVYPAAYGPVLSVGACNQQDNRASFSSFGVSLDLLAPGVAITSTLMGQTYGLMQGGSGTSYAAPFASGVAGLILSLHPSWQPADVKSIMKSTSDDVGPSGWDPQSGQGILRADHAVQINEALAAEISSPVLGQGFASVDTIYVFGSASGIYLDKSYVYVGVGNNPDNWNLIKILNGEQVVNGLLAPWLASALEDTIYTIRLVVQDKFGAVVEDRVTVTVDLTPPNITNIQLLNILDGNRPSYLLTFHTDDLTSGRIMLQESEQPNSRWVADELSYRAHQHYVLLGQDYIFQQFRYYITVTNTAGLVDSTGILGTINLNLPMIQNNTFVELPSSQIPRLYLYEEATDLDGDGFKEVWGDTLLGNGGRSDLRGYEATSNFSFADMGLDFGRQIPKSIGDSDADGKKELLTLYGGASKIFEANSVGGFPDPANIVWSDSGDVWGAKLLDLVPTDNHGEILYVTGGEYQLWSRWDNGTVQYVQTLTNPFTPTATTLPPYCRVGDFDNDGLTELLFGDYDGNLFIYEMLSQTGLGLHLTWQASLPLLDTGEFLTDGDYDGDGHKEFAAAAHSETTLSGEHEADTRYWGLYIFKNTGLNDTYTIIDSLFFFGAEDPADFPSGISSGNVNGDIADEILLCVYPDFYVVAKGATANQFEATWFYPQCESNKAVIADFNQNGHSEFIFSDGANLKTFESFGNWSYWPPPPLGFTVTPKMDRVLMNWLVVPGADSYNIYKGFSPTTLSILTEVQPEATSFTDFSVILDSTYFYAISTVQLSAPFNEGPKTLPLGATPNTPPFIVGDTAYFTPPNFVSIEFSEPMNGTMLNPNNYFIATLLNQPNSVASDRGGTRAILAFAPIFTDTLYRLVVHDLSDLQGTSFSSIDTILFVVPQGNTNQPYLESAFADQAYRKLTLVFSTSMHLQELEYLGNYSLSVDPIQQFPTTDPILISSVSVNPQSPDRVDLSINPATPIGAMGRILRVTAHDIFSSYGTPIDTSKNSLAITFASANLDRTFVYPNPYQAGTLVDGEPCMVFSNLTPDAEIRILTLSGTTVKTLKTSGNFTGGVRWYLDNDQGEKVGSGIYLYFIKGDGSTFRGKLAIVR
jgi:subtilisin family serine protease